MDQGTQTSQVEVEPNVASALGYEPTTILVADDDELIAASLVQNIAELGYEVIGPAGTGEQAIELAKRHNPDLALLDICMPNVDGLGAAIVLYKHMNIPVILVTAHSDSEYVQAGQRIGVFGYLLKPVDINDLRVTIPVAWSRFCVQEGLRSSLQDMKQALEDRKCIERAKGLLMEKLGISENTAAHRLKQQARNSRRKIADLARAIIETEHLLNGAVSDQPVKGDEQSD